jgi:outer membrane biogenesis lipoprotein LolB
MFMKKMTAVLMAIALLLGTACAETGSQAADDSF